MVRVRMDRRHRQYLRPWLEETLNEGRIRGVEWINREEKRFKLPWKRNSDQTTRDDFEIFRAWAAHTGREGEDDGTSAVYTKWKTRLRCAIHKAPDIQEERERHQVDPSMDEPFKVYRFLNVSVTPGCYSPRQSPPSSCEDSQDSPYSGQPCAVAEIPAVVNQFDETRQMSTSSSVDVGKFPSDLDMCSADLIRGTRELSLSQAINSKGEVEDITQPLKFPLSHLEQHVAPTTCSTVVAPGAMAPPLTAGVAQSAMPPVATVPSDTCMSMSSGLSATGFAEGACFNQGGHHLMLQIYYRGQRVMTQEVVKQCRVSHADPILPTELLSQMSGPQDIPKFEMPSCQQASTHGSCQQASTAGSENYIEALLRHMQHGFIVDYEDNGDVYVTRYCKAGLFAEFPNSVEIKKLERGVRTKVFDQEVFETYLKQFINGTAKKPSHDVVLVIGQKPVNNLSAYLIYVTLSGSKSAGQLVKLEDQLRCPSAEPALVRSISNEFDSLCKHTTNNTECESMDTE